MYVVGLNHKTAPIEIREKFYLNPAQQDMLLSELKSHPKVSECFILSTCNRVEIYINRIDDSVSVLELTTLIAKVKKINLDINPRNYVYEYAGKDVIKHLLNVACGLDSLVLGEKQILGQVNHAAQRARELGVLSKYFNILTNLAIRAGKKAQHETAISQGGSSVSWAAIELAQQEMGGSLLHKTVVVIGAGKMGEIALEQLKSRGVGKTYLMNRTGEKAEDLAIKYNGIPASFFDMKDILTEVDVCFCCVGAPHYILNKEMVAKVMQARQNNHLVMIDISMPRNIDPAVSELQGLTLRAIDDLKPIVHLSQQKREAAVGDVEDIIRQKLVEYDEKISKLTTINGTDFYVR